MHLSGFHIDGFGIYHDQGVTALPRGLVLLVGENESGKSTLLEFIRTMLFGYPRRDKKTNDYLPLRGGNQGGRLQVIMQDGRQYTVARQGRQGVSLAPDDGVGLPELLGGLERQTFKQVFAVGLEDLQGLELLSQDGVRGRLFAAGAGLGAASVPDVLKKLDKELDGLLTQRGHKVINQVVRGLRELDGRIQQLRQLSSDYAAGRDQLEELRARLAAQQEEATTLGQKLSWLTQLEQACQPYAERNLAREKAAALAFARDFPANGLERFERLLKQLADLRAARSQRQSEAGELELQLSRLTVDETLLAQRQAIEELGSEREKLLTAERDVPLVHGAQERAEAEFSRKLRDLGPDWDAPRLARVDTSVAVRQQVQDLARQLAAQEQVAERTRMQQQALEEAAAAAQRRWEAAELELQALPPRPEASAAALLAQQEAVRQLRIWLPRRDLAATLLTVKTAAREEAGERLKGLEQQSEPRPPAVPWWLSLSGLILGLAAGGWLAFQRLYLQGGIAFGAGFALAALFYFLWRRQGRAEQRRQAELRQETGRVQQGLLSLEAENAELAGQVETAASALSQAAAVLEAAPPRDAGEVETWSEILAQTADLLRQWQEREHDREQAAAAGDEAAARLRQAEADAAAAAGALQDLRVAWSGWLAARGFRDPVRPEGFEAVLQAVEHARSAALSLEDSRGRVAQLTEYLGAVRGRLLKVMAACGRSPGPGRSVGVADLDGLRRALAAALEVQQRQSELKVAIEAQGRDLRRLNGQIGEQEAELDNLTAQAGAGGEEEFRRLAQAHENWRSQEQKITAGEIALRAIAVSAAAQAALEEELSRTDPLSLLAEKARLQARLSELEQAITADNQEVGRVEHNLELMAQNEELGNLLFEQRQSQEALAAASRRWVALALTRHLVEQARAVYERERQPAVIQEADGFLELMAHGRYRLLSSLEAGGIVLEDRRALGSKSESQWSAGLADQVYLAIRLGLAREFGRHSEPLPVILDDVLVKFDPRRRAQAARVILELAREQQVLLFSCHPEITGTVIRLREQEREPAAPLACFQIVDGVISPAAVE
jgi:uncharacterized protein YhaN